ncbi:hypothetical protein [Priestia megaterium]|uniref:hypothetical protein n=1 Tax=Priestia megaterium TaxID=1404 RepID=UPI00203FC60A|nr:hypothetical protein [Priestia megaterium]MCM3196691.1 hypothetical protein [Priestia megaterium]
MIGGKGGDSWGISGRPRKTKSCTEINCGVISGSAHVYELFVFQLDIQKELVIWSNLYKSITKNK